MAGIDELKSLISSRGGLARSNQFLIQIPQFRTLSIPGFEVLQGLTGFTLPVPTINDIPGLLDDLPNSRDLDLLCKTAEIPGKQILTSPRAVGMQPELVAYGYAVPDVSMTFHLLNDYGVRKFFESWKSSIINEETSEVGYKRDYQRDIKIHQLKRPITNKEAKKGPFDIFLGPNGNTVYTVILEDAFPTTIQSVALTNDLDAIAEMTVQFSYTNVKVVEQNLLTGLAKIGIGLLGNG
jgi:hypothetical protein